MQADDANLPLRAESRSGGRSPSPTFAGTLGDSPRLSVRGALHSIVRQSGEMGSASLPPVPSTSGRAPASSPPRRSPPPRVAVQSPRRFQHLMALRKAGLERELGKGVEVKGRVVHDIRDTVRDRWNAREMDGAEKEEQRRRDGAGPGLELRDARNKRRASPPRAPDAFMAPLAIQEARRKLVGREGDPKGILPTALYATLHGMRQEAKDAERDVRVGRGGLRRAVERANGPMDMAAVGQGGRAVGCPGILLPQGVLGNGESAIVSCCVNTKRRLLLTSDDKQLCYYAPDRPVLSVPLPPGTTTRHLMYDRVADVVFAVRGEHKILTLHPRQLTPLGIPKTSEDAVLCAAIGIKQRVVVTGHAKGVITVWRIHDPELLGRPSAASAASVRLVATQHLEPPSGVTEGHWVSEIIVTEGDMEWAMAAVDTSVHLWDLRRGALVMRMECLHDLPITSLSFDEEAKHLATGSSDWTVRVWDLKKDVMELTVAALVAEDKRATLAETLASHRAPVTNVLWHPTSRVLLSSSEDGYLRMYDGKSIEEWDSLQLVQVGMAGTSECGIPTAGDELPETVRLSFLNIVDAHAEGFYVAAAVGPRVAFLDVQPGKRFLAGLPQPAVQLHLRGHAAPAGWQEGRPWTPDVFVLDEHGGISVLDTRTGSCSVEFQTQSRRILAGGQGRVDPTRELPFWFRASRAGADVITCCLVLEHEDEVYTGWSRGGLEVQTLRPSGKGFLEDLAIRKADYLAEHPVNREYAVTCLCRIQPRALADMDMAGLHRALRKLRDFEGHRWNDGGKSKNSNSRGQANAAGDAMRGFLQIIRAARAGRRWRERVRKPIVVYGTSDGLLVMATRQRNTRPHIVEAHASPVVQVIPVDVRSSIVSLDRDNHVKIWGFVPPQALPMTLKTRALPGILAPMMQFQVPLQAITCVAFVLRHNAPPAQSRKVQRPQTEIRPHPVSAARPPRASAPGLALTRNDAVTSNPSTVNASTTTTAIATINSSVSAGVAEGAPTDPTAPPTAVLPSSRPVLQRRLMVIETHTGALERPADREWVLEMYLGGGTGDVCHVEVAGIESPTQEEVNEVLSAMPHNTGSMPPRPPVRHNDSCRVLRTLMLHRSRVAAIAVSDALIASADMNGAVVVWDAHSRRALAQVPFREPVEHLAFVSPKEIIAVIGASINSIHVSENVWGKSVAAAEERARNAQDSGGNDGEYEYRYAIDFPDDAYLRAVQRVAYVTVFAPGSQEHRELVHLLEQIRASEEHAFDIEYALEMIEKEVRAQMEVQAAVASDASSSDDGESSSGEGSQVRNPPNRHSSIPPGTHPTQPGQGRGQRSHQRKGSVTAKSDGGAMNGAMVTSHTSGLDRDNADHASSTIGRRESRASRVGSGSVGAGGVARGGVAEGSHHTTTTFAAAYGGVAGGSGVMGSGVIGGSIVTAGGSVAGRSEGLSDAGISVAISKGPESVVSSDGRSRLAAASGLLPAIGGRGGQRGQNAGDGAAAGNGDNPDAWRMLANKLGTSTARSMLGPNRGSFRSAPKSAVVIPPEGRGLTHEDNAKQHLSKGIIIPRAAHDLLHTKWSAAQIDALGGTWFDVLKATTFTVTGEIPIPRGLADKGTGGKRRKRRRRKADKAARLARAADELTAAAYVSDAEAKMEALGLNDYAGVLAGMPREAPAAAGEGAGAAAGANAGAPANAKRRRRRRRRRPVDAWKLQERERQLREKMSRIRFVLTSITLPRAEDIGI